jgi:DNA-damage-inducible protein D
MKENEIKHLFKQFESIACEYNNVECWSARKLQKLLDYAEWRNFCKTIDKAKESCKNANISVLEHFVDVNKMVQIGSSAEKAVDDIFLTRYAYYLVCLKTALLLIFCQQLALVLKNLQQI